MDHRGRDYYGKIDAKWNIVSPKLQKLPVSPRLAYKGHVVLVLTTQLLKTEKIFY